MLVIFLEECVSVLATQLFFGVVAPKQPQVIGEWMVPHNRMGSNPALRTRSQANEINSQNDIYNMVPFIYSSKVQNSKRLNILKLFS